MALLLFESTIIYNSKNKKRSSIYYTTSWWAGMDSPSRVGKIVQWTIFLSSFSNPLLFIILKIKKRSSMYYTTSWWAGMDSNHRTLSRPDLQSGAINHSTTYPCVKHVLYYNSIWLHCQDYF